MPLRKDWFYYHLPTDFPEFASNHINLKEAFCIILSAVKWAPHWRNHKVHVYCDNTAAVAMINKGTTANSLMMRYLRLLFWLSATYNFRITAIHIPGKLNTTADHISRLDESSHFLEFLWFLHGGSLPSFSGVLAFPHMSLRTYIYLIHKFGSQA